MRALSVACPHKMAADSQRGDTWYITHQNVAALARYFSELSRRALLVSTSLCACGNDISHTTAGRVVLSRRPLSGGKEAVSGSPRRVAPHVTGAAVRLLLSSEPRKEAYHPLCVCEPAWDACWTCITACGAWHQFQEQRWRGDRLIQNSILDRSDMRSLDRRRSRVR